MHISRGEIGKSIPRWGSAECESLESEVRKAFNSPVEVTNCLLSAVVVMLGELKSTLYEIRNNTEKVYKKEDHYSDGILQSGDTELTGDVISSKKLSVRARKALARSGVRFVSEITEEKLSSLRQCGQKTIDEIIAKFGIESSE